MSSLLPTTSDAQCTRSSIFSGGCEADEGYDPSTCTMYGLKCYSTTAKQCKAGQCSTSILSGGECINDSGGGSLYCRRGGPFYSCECYVPIYTANTWPSMAQSGAYFFPEQCLPRWSHSKVSTGISLAMSGGGNRAFLTALGMVRALTDTQVGGGKDGYTVCDYVSSVSGGSWFNGTYVFALGKGYTESELLGTALAPQNCTLKLLHTHNFEDGEGTSKLIGRVTNQDIALNLLEALVPGNDVELEDAYGYVIGEVFLEPYGIDANVPVALNAEHADLIRSNNPGLAPAIVPKASAPFWLCNAGIQYRPLYSKGIIPAVVTTPLYTGSPQIVQADDGAFIGGSYMDTFAIGSEAPTVATPIFAQSCESTVVQVQPLENTVMTLSNMVAASSSVLSSILFIEDGISLDRALPSYEMWSPAAPGVTQSCVMADGGVINNPGIIALLARGVTKIVCNYANGQTWDSSQVLLTEDAMGEIMAMFGVLPEGYTNAAAGVTYKGAGNLVQVFDSKDWPAFRAMFVQTRATGGPMYSRATLNVLPNLLYGISGNYTVDLFIMMLNSSTEFVSALPAETQAEIAKGSWGKFANFPTYPLFLENYTAITAYTRAQSNLLYAYSYWCWTHPSVQAHLKEMYAQ